MKSKNITTIIIEGVDGVGKDSVAHEMWQVHDKHFRVYVRGELSDFVYAKKYNRQFISTQRGLPFIYVLLVARKEKIVERLNKREKDKETLLRELAKLEDQELFIEYAHKFALDYHVMIYDTTFCDAKTAAKEIYAAVQRYSDNLKKDASINEYNEMYKRGCDKLGLDFYVRNNQPFIENNSIMADAQLHNGSYETFSDKTMPHNFIFSLGYNDFTKVTDKKYDFAYIIGSKIAVRPEVDDYISAFKCAGLSCMTKSTFSDKVFGDKYIDRLALSRCTVYCCRDLAYLKMITVRPYEAALAMQILFVDRHSDPNCEILRQIYDSHEIIDKLYTTEKTIAPAYLSLTDEEKQFILRKQKDWYISLKKKIGAQYNVNLC